MGPFSKYLLAALLFVSCGTKKDSALNEWMKDNGKLKVLATTPIVASLVRDIGGDHIDIMSLIGDDLDPHSYEIVKGDSERMARADVIFASGLSLEHSASIRYQLSKHYNVLYIGDSIMNSAPQEIIYVNKQPDPHFWMDVKLWSQGVDPIVERLSQIDPDHAADYTTRGVLVKNTLLAKDAAIRDLFDQIPSDKKYLVTVHDAFNYFGRRYLATAAERKAGTWWPRMIAVQGIAPDEQISALDIGRVVDDVIQYNISVLFPEQNLSADPLKKVVEACSKKGKMVKLASDPLYSDTMGSRTYLEMMDHNATVIRDNL